MPDELLEAARQVARQAGALLAEKYTAPLKIEHKGAIDLVTDADRASEDLIKTFISKRFADHSILAEESGAQNSGQAVRWVIDPLDGTVNFAHRNAHFCVLIAVQDRCADGSYQTRCSVTYDPLRQEEFVARRGHGASLNGQPIAVTQTSELLQSLGATGFPYDRLWGAQDNHAEFCRLSLLTQGIRRFGSAGLDLAYVACGRYDLYWEYRLFPWDYSAGVLLVEEAGGKVTDLAGGSISDGTLLSSNAHLHAVSLAALASTRAAPVNGREGLRAFLPASLHGRLPPGT
jgi:myo-inositol-1(or 4)-monophosphatase